jgi:hypothetical protein
MTALPVAVFAAIVAGDAEAQSSTEGVDTARRFAVHVKEAPSRLMWDDGAIDQVASRTSERRDSVLNGVLIGAGIGALFGLIPDHYDDCEECHDSLYGSIAVGAGVGLIVDLLRHPKSTASPSRVDNGVQLDVTVGRRAVGLRGRFAWR